MAHPRFDDLVTISAAAVAEVSRADPSAALDSVGWPIASDLIAHLGNHFGWVLATIGAEKRPPSGPGAPERSSIPEWFAGERDRFIETLSRMPDSTPCWTLAGPGELSFWYRRSMFEIARHVWDLRTAGGVRPAPPPELSPARYADGVTEHFDVFLERSRHLLDPLPGTIRLVASDTDASWRLSTEWSRLENGTADAVIHGSAGELALLCWERADALAQPQFEVSGSDEVVRAFQAAPIHR